MTRGFSRAVRASRLPKRRQGQRAGRDVLGQQRVVAPVGDETPTMAGLQPHRRRQLDVVPVPVVAQRYIKADSIPDFGADLIY